MTEDHSQIASELTSEGIKSPGGKNTWYKETLKKILENEVYRGNYLYQKYFIKDTFGEKVAKNNGELLQYLIENHHEAIIQSSDWEKVQTIIKERYKNYLNKYSVKDPKENLKNIAFENKFHCGECGSLIGHRNNSEKAYEKFCWICNSGHKYYVSNRCEARSFHQKYLELHFMRMLLDIKYSQEFIKEIERVIDKTDLNQEELTLEEDMKKRMAVLNQKLYLVVDEELNKDGQDSRKVDELTEEIVKLQSKLKENSDRKQLAKKYRDETEWLLKELQGIDESFNGNLELLNKERKVPFREDIFSRIVDSGIIFKNGEIVYMLKLGIEWSADFRYADYKQMILDKKDAERKAEKDKFFKSSEIKELLKFCGEPRTCSEMKEFECMIDYKYKSNCTFIRAIIKPLIEEGRLKRTIPDNPSHVKQKYYSVKQK